MAPRWDGYGRVIFTTFLLFFMPAGEAMSPGRADAPVLQFRSRIVIRVPAITPMPRNVRRKPPPPTIEWKESKGPHCVPVRLLRGFAVTDEDSLDMVMRDGSRVRARLDSDCSMVDFRYGIYLHAGDDGMICEDRDSIHARSGGECAIERFRKLSLKR